MGSGGRAGALPSFEACLLRTMATGHRCYLWREEGGRPAYRLQSPPGRADACVSGGSRSCRIAVAGVLR